MRQVAAPLTLGDVVFFGEQSGRPTGRPVAFEPCAGGERFASLVIGQRQEETAQREGALSLSEFSVVMAEPVDVALLHQLLAHRLDSGDAARVGGGQRTTDRRQ